MSALSQAEKNRIAALKEQLAKEIIQTSTLSTLTQIEKDFLNEILARHLKDKIGNYDARIKELFQDIYIVRGIKYRNIHLLNQSTYSYLLSPIFTPPTCVQERILLIYPEHF